MCGILLLLQHLQNQTIDITTEFNKQKHRGPDNTQIKQIDDLTFCFHRLAIINPNNTNGMQPITLNNDNLILICNGEIYNYKQLQEDYLTGDIHLNVDVEVIGHLYLEYGIEKTCKLLDGDFAFIIYDKISNKIYTGRDSVGLKPLYFGYYNNKLVACSSEIKSICSYCDKIEHHDIGSYSIIDKSTQVIESIHKFFTIQDNTTIDTIQDNTTIESIQNQIPETIKSKIKELLVKSVNKRIQHTDQPYAFLCSGGIDSSLVLALAIECLGVENLHVFSIELENDRSDDSTYAKILTDTYGVKHTIVKFSKEEGHNKVEEVIKHIESYDVNTIRASIPMFILAEYISKNTEYKVILSGEGADELFMGYNYFNYFDDDNEANDESIRLVKNLYSFDVLRAERCFSSHGLELRVPFLDKEFIEYVLTLDGTIKKPHERVEKYILRQSFADLAKMPTYILNRQKERFSDGIGFGWVPSLINFCEQQSKVNNYDFNDKMYNKPKTSEEKYYRKFFEQSYPNHANIILKREMPHKITDYINKQRGSGLLGM